MLGLGPESTVVPEASPRGRGRVPNFRKRFKVTEARLLWGSTGGGMWGVMGMLGVTVVIRVN